MIMIENDHIDHNEDNSNLSMVSTISKIVRIAQPASKLGQLASILLGNATLAFQGVFGTSRSVEKSIVSFSKVRNYRIKPLSSSLYLAAGICHGSAGICYAVSTVRNQIVAPSVFSLRRGWDFSWQPIK